jgi:hypothetical protein
VSAHFMLDTCNINPELVPSHFSSHQRVKSSGTYVVTERHSVFFKQHIVNRDSVVSIATSYGLDERGVGIRVPVRSRILSSPRRPDRLWGPPN